MNTDTPVQDPTSRLEAQKAAAAADLKQQTDAALASAQGGKVRTTFQGQELTSFSQEDPDAPPVQIPQAIADLIPEKFRRADPMESIAEALKHRSELEKLFSSRGSSVQKQEQKADGKPEEDKGDKPKAKDEGKEAGSAPEVGQGPPDFPKELTERASQEILSTGDLSHETRKLFWTRGYSNEHIDGQIALLGIASKYVALAIEKEAGGSEEWARALDYVKKNLPPEEQELLNFRLDARDKDIDKKIKAVVRTVMDRYSAANGSSRRLQGQSPVGLRPFESQAEFDAWQSDPLYWQKGPAGDKYRLEFGARARATELAYGTPRG